MTVAAPDLIRQSGRPAFFALGAGAAAGLDAPENRIGEAVRTRVQSLAGFQKEALVASARGGPCWRLVSDEGPYLDGHDAAPCPLAFLSVGMAAGFMEEIAALARARGVRLGRLRLIQDNYYTMKGSMPRRTMVGGAEPVEMVVEAECDLDDAELQALVLDAVAAAPVHGLMRARLESLFALSHNARRLAPGRVAALPGALLPDPAPLFTGFAPAGASPVLVEPVGRTPRKPVAGGTAGAGTSLAAEQDRRLNIGAMAEIGTDGIKRITQMQYSPHGTAWRFLSAEDGRAPGWAVLVSAGLGFCFMTQFGRFVSMLGLDLPGYRIVQDTHFSLGGASGGTGGPGRAEPVETHVFLDSAEPAATAREMLDIAEQTCFLHALCRAELKPKLTVRRL